MIGRGHVAAVAALLILVVPLASAGQQAPKPWRIGYLTGATPEPANVEALRQGLRELGHVEGKDFVLEFRSADGAYERLPALARELVRLRIDVIVAVGTPGPVAAKQVTTTIPIVMTNGGDPVGTGLVASLARPGGNVTGMSVVIPDLIGKQMQLLTEVVPGASRVAVLSNPDNQMHRLALREAETATRQLKLQLLVAEMRGADDVAGAFVTLAKERASALVVLSDAITVREHRRIAELALKHRLPTIFPTRSGAEAGCLLALGTNFSDSYRRAADYIDKILKGARPADLPVQQPTKYELFINARTAKALALTIPPTLLLRADKVIE